MYCKILRKSQALVLYSVCSYLTVTNGRILEHEFNNPQGLRERERGYIVRRKHNRKRRDLREKGSSCEREVSQKISSCIIGCSGTVCTLSRYNINTVRVDIASSLKVNHVKSVCGATVHVIVFYLLVIFYLLHELS